MLSVIAPGASPAACLQARGQIPAAAFSERKYLRYPTTDNYPHSFHHFVAEYGDIGQRVCVCVLNSCCWFVISA